MTTPEPDGRTRSDPVDLRGARLVGADLSGADLSGAVMRAVDIAGAEIDAPWLLEDIGTALLVNGVDVVPYVDAELDRRFPGRGLRRATDPDGLRAAWAALEATWTGTLQRARAMAPGSVDVSVRGEWTFTQTLRHLVMATDTWLRGAVLGVEQPFHPVGQPDAAYERNGHDLSVFSTRRPGFAEVLEVRAGRVAMVREHLRTVTPDDLASTRAHPWAPQHRETVLSCLRTILEEEWEHHRFAVRDLDAIEAGRGGAVTGPVPPDLT